MGSGLSAVSPDEDVLDRLDAYAADVECAPAAVVARRTLVMLAELERARPEWGMRDRENAIVSTLRCHARMREVRAPQRR